MKTKTKIIIGSTLLIAGGLVGDLTSLNATAFALMVIGAGLILFAILADQYSL